MERGVDIRLLCQMMTQMTDAIADAVVKRTTPQQDDISEREAFRQFGRYWVTQMAKADLIHPYRVGGKKIYSRHELDTVRLTQRTYAKLK